MSIANWNEADLRRFIVGYILNDPGSFPKKKRPLITGSRGGNVALTNLLIALDQLGLITNSTT